MRYYGQSDPLTLTGPLTVTGAITGTNTSAGATTDGLTLVNLHGSASTATRINLQPSASSSRRAEIVASNNGSNVISLDFLLSNGASPTSILALSGAGSATVTGTLGVTSDLTVDTNTLFVQASTNRVGIGTLSPSVALHVTTADQSTARLRLDNTGASGQAWDVVAGTPGVSNTGLSFFNTTGGTQLHISNTASASRHVTITGSNGGNPTIGTSAGSLAVSAAAVFASTCQVNGNFLGVGTVSALSAEALTAGGKLAYGATTGGPGIYTGSGNPTVSAAQGSIYLKSDGSGIADRLWVNTNGTTGWTNFVSAA